MKEIDGSNQLHPEMSQHSQFNTSLLLTFIPIVEKKPDVSSQLAPTSRQLKTNKLYLKES